MIKSLRVAGLLAGASIKRGNIGVILLIIIILTIISLNSLFIPGLLQGLISGANSQLRNTYSSDIIVESSTAQPLLSNVDSLINKIDAIDGVAGAAPINVIGAQFVFGTQRTDADVYSVQPDMENQVFTINKSMIEGTYLSPGDTDQIILGVQLAGASKPNLDLYARSLLTVRAGDVVNVIYGDGLQKSYTVKGIFYTEFLQTDIEAFVTQTEMEKINPLTKNAASSIHVKVKSDSDIPDVINKINGIQSGFKILKWEDYAGIVRSLTDSFNIINVILNVINLLIAGITVFIVTYIDVVNRKRQIGVQRAIGITPGSITLSYLMRAVFYSVTAIVLAILLFAFVVAPLETRYPFYFPFGAVYLVIGPADILRMTVIVISVSLLASFLPVRGIMKMKIMDAIWG
jgi:putative ABC transport system permease protein